MPTTPHSAQDRQCQAVIPHSGCDRSPVRQLRSLLRHSERCGDTVGTCDAVLDVLGTAPATVLPTLRTSFVLSPLRNPRMAWARPSEAAPTLTRTGPWPAGPSEHRHATPGGRYPLQQPPHRPLKLRGRRRDLRKTKDDARTTATPDSIPHSALSTVFDHCTPRFGEKTTASPFSRACTPPLLVSIKGGGGFYLRGTFVWIEYNTQHHSQSTDALLSPDISTRLNQLLL